MEQQNKTKIEKKLAKKKLFVKFVTGKIQKVNETKKT